ncbi:MAG: hypothetical protein FWH48_04815 [Oscillospiraceae bacterium]|nr:hypothetical protein [Oscillospiraceae bacterium]MCL2158712.1 hypothetical protein [Oscillospiraceae bacterium]
MREAKKEELIELFKDNLDYVLELGILQEPKLCKKPVYKFERAFVCGDEFCLVYSEADDSESVFVSYNSHKFEQIIGEYEPAQIVFHGEPCEGGELCESYYFNRENFDHTENTNCRLLGAGDKKLARAGGEYLNIIFENFIEKKVWADCGIIGAFDGTGDFAGYLAYYELAQDIRDVSYIYTKTAFRGLGYAKQLLNCFKRKNILENKVSYYSYAVDEVSANLAKSCGFLPCAKRYEINRER